MEPCSRVLAPQSGARELPLYLVEVYIIATGLHFLGNGILPTIRLIHFNVDDTRYIIGSLHITFDKSTDILPSNFPDKIAVFEDYILSCSRLQLIFLRFGCAHVARSIEHNGEADIRVRLDLFDDGVP